ncbi:hypothetical protein [Candidatus Nitrospira neomarina]|uniref:AAA domain-containing protein n=1 Tax=Candidatus Nitrospira neomarina TaxID=3020899 RepID=A0AA96GET5_9BACT|nr:hypothetical protein [Candidatus Nitrospira neomarina]WNM60864.1 hypothetical protein PQG83_13985 [Candidatus Nitrospira neomarina]
MTILSTLTAAIQRSRVVVLSGPRQSVKTTLARESLSEDFNRAIGWPTG